MPAEIQSKILSHSSPFTKFVNGRLLKAELLGLPMKQREQVWREAMDVAWQGDLGMLPWINHNKARLSLPSRGTLERIRDASRDCDWRLAAIQHGWVDMLADCPANDVARAAAKQGDVELLLDAIDVRKADMPIKDLASVAASNGHFELAKLLMSRVPDEKWPREIAIDAAAQGSLDMVVWIDKHHPDSFDHFVMDRAAELGHLHIVRWLADHRSEGCSCWAFDRAAKNDNLEMLELLYERYHGVLSAETRTYLLQFVSSDRQIIEWLVSRRLVEPNKLIKHIAGTGKIDILAWAIKRFGVKLAENHLDDAYKGRHTALLKWAFTTGGVKFGRWSASKTALSCNTDLMSWLISRDRSLVPLLVQECALRGDISLVEWWQVRHGGFFGQGELEAAVAMCNRRLVWRVISEDEGGPDLTSGVN
ncbi:hypothetical protein HK105_208149 [Polyrhizophydium stewartii]|uniref:Ankyrin repeat protein n=1 Tax=Polyrhizophydium stewartii TaxID=2732419 RepID=A0ABR4MYM6_9FUNG